MKYDKVEFFDLMERAEEQGAIHLDLTCDDREFEFPRHSGDGVRTHVVRGCGYSSLFSVPYFNGKDTVQAKFCAVDDDMGKWPRFGGDRHARR